MTPSLGEVQATALKACRGAGLPWGLCEEAAWATRWLWTHGLDGTGALAALLDGYDPDVCPIRAAAWKLLKRLEGRTYAPPSDSSRAGAGAGLTDND